MADEKLEKLSVLINNFAYSCIRFGEIHKDGYYSGSTILSQARDMMDLNKEVLLDAIKEVINDKVVVDREKVINLAKESMVDLAYNADKELFIKDILEIMEYCDVEKLQAERNEAFEEYWQKKVKLLKELAYSEIVFERIKKFLRHKKRSIARRALGKIYHKKLSVFDSWIKHKCRVYNIRLRKY